jgi:hypothetical protein
MPVAVIEKAHAPDMRVLRATLAGLANSSIARAGRARRSSSSAKWRPKECRTNARLALEAVK